MITLLNPIDKNEFENWRVLKKSDKLSTNNGSESEGKCSDGNITLHGIIGKIQFFLF